LYILNMLLDCKLLVDNSLIDFSCFYSQFNKGYSTDPASIEGKVKNSKFAHYAELIPEIAHSQIHELYGRSDAFIMTSIQEGQPVSALEAGCCGLPIFSTICGGVEDYVTDDIGRLFKVSDSESFAESLKDFLEDRISFDNQKIRDTIISRYGKKAFVDNFATCINAAINERASRTE